MSANIRPSGIFDTTYAQDIALNRTLTDKLTSYGLIAVLLVLPLLAIEGPFGLNIIPQSWIGTVIRISIYAIAVQGLNLLVGYTGQISLGHAAFMAVGAYSSAIYVRELGLPFWFALPMAALTAGGVGLIFGLPSLRVKGFYLAMATLAAAYMIPWLIRYPFSQVTNGERPLEVPFPTLFGISFAHESAMYYVIVPLAVLMFLLARNIIRTRTGRAFISIRDNDLAAELLGINVFSYKLQAFFLSALYAGVAGALLSFENNTISLEFYGFQRSIEMLAMLVIGGAGFPLGSLFGVAFVSIVTQNLIPSITPWLENFLPQFMPFVPAENIESALSPILFGLILAVFLILEPRGLAYRWEILKISWKIRPFSH